MPLLPPPLPGQGLHFDPAHPGCWGEWRCLTTVPLCSPQEFLWEKEGSDAPLQLSSDSVLIFPFLNKSDSGTYVCTATSSMGSVVAKYNLDVSGKRDRRAPGITQFLLAAAGWHSRFRRSCSCL